MDQGSLQQNFVLIGNHTSSCNFVEMSLTSLAVVSMCRAESRHKCGLLHAMPIPVACVLQQALALCAHMHIYSSSFAGDALLFFAFGGSFDLFFCRLSSSYQMSLRLDFLLL